MALGLEESEVFLLALRLLVPVAGEAEQVAGSLSDKLDQHPLTGEVDPEVTAWAAEGGVLERR